MSLPSSLLHWRVAGRGPFVWLSLLLGLVAAYLICYSVLHHVRSAYTIRALRDAGAYVHTSPLYLPLVGDVSLPEHLLPSYAHTLVILKGRAASDAQLSRLRWLGSLTDLYIRDREVLTDDAVSHIARLRNLRYLLISKCTIREEGLGALGDMTELTALAVPGTGISDRGLAHLVCLERLKVLDLSGTAVSDLGMVHLRKLKDLSILRLAGTAVGDRGIT